jgi:F-type H+-transporting ATPase subunit epsilon
MNLTILTPEKEIFRGEVTSVKVPGTMGEFQVLPNHAPIVSSLETGAVELITAKGSHRFFDEESGSIKTAEEPDKKMVFRISGGFIEVLKNEISLLVRGTKNM